jgi:hypothetical protein
LTVEDDAGGGVEFGFEGTAFAFHGKVVRHGDDDCCEVVRSCSSVVFVYCNKICCKKVLTFPRQPPFHVSATFSPVL